MRVSELPGMGIGHLLPRESKWLLSVWASEDPVIL
jgi:hypothetical protein